MVQRITISASQFQNQLQGELPGALIALEADQVHYLTRVLRMKSGDRFIAQNGQGQQWLVTLGQQAAQAYVLSAIATPTAPVTAPLRLIAALPKGNNFDQVVRQTTELGVTHIYPIITERTLLKPSDSKLTRWRRIAQEASEQSERITVPEIFEPMSFQQCMVHPPWETPPANASANVLELRYLCAARSVATSPDSESIEPTHLLAHLLAHQSANLAPVNLPSVTLAIGPEGGWTAAEITVAINNGYKVVSLGTVILRAVTAPVTALSLVTAARELLI